jgi:hypothetical protein
MKNYQRMLDLVVNFFGTREDGDQITVTPEELKRLLDIHHATMTEVANEDGPILWLLLVPTTAKVMYEFLERIISERQLLLETIPGQEYTAIYLCSIYVLPEFRKQGLSRKTMIEAINQIQKDHPIKSLYYWPFSNEGKQLATSIAEELDLPLFEKA